MGVQHKNSLHEDKLGVVGEMTITGKNQVSLPACGLWLWAGTRATA